MERSSPTSLFPRSGAVAILGTPLPPPYTTPSMQANLVLRVTLSLLAGAVSVVPLRVLHRNGEFAAAVFIANTLMVDLETVVSSLLWHDDNMAQWWAGWGYCDVVVHLHNASGALFITCLLAMMRNLARQVGLMRASPLTGTERTRRNLVQGLIMFPLPLLQVAWTLAAATRRYEVGTLIGCSWNPHPSWPNLAFFIMPPVVLAFITSGYASESKLLLIKVGDAAKLTLGQSSLTSASAKSQRSPSRPSRATSAQTGAASAPSAGSI